MDENLQKARAFFEGDRFAMVNGAVIEAAGPDYVRCSMELNETHYNAVGAVMGGAIFTLADLAFAVCANWGKSTCVSQTSQITFLGGAKGKRLIAEARPVKEGRSTRFYAIDVKDELGNLVAHMTESGFVLF